MVPASGSCGTKKVVCYYPSWAYWRSGDGKFTVEDIDFSLCSHVVYAFALLDINTFGVRPWNSSLVRITVFRVRDN